MLFHDVKDGSGDNITAADATSTATTATATLGLGDSRTPGLVARNILGGGWAPPTPSQRWPRAVQITTNSLGACHSPRLGAETAREKPNRQNRQSHKPHQTKAPLPERVFQID